MTRVLCLALLIACGADEAASEEESESSTETEASPERSAAGQAGGEASAAEAPRPNRSAGPVRAGFQVVPQRMHRRSVTTITIFGRHAAAGTARGMVTIFDVPSGHVRAARRLFFGAVGELRVSDDRKRILALGSGTGEDESPVEAVVWDLEVDRVWPVPNDYSYIRAMSPDGRWIATIPAQSGDEPAELQLAEVWGEVRTRRLDDTVGDVFFARDSRTLFVVGDGKLLRLGVPGLRPRGEPWPVSGRIAARHPSEDLVALAGSTSVAIHSLEDGSEKAELTAPDRLRWLEWSPDGSRLAVHGRRGRVFSGDDWSTTQNFESPRRTHMDLVSDTPAALVNAHGKLVYTPVDGSDPIELEPEIHQGVAFPPRAGWFLYGNQGDVHIANVERRRTRRLVRGGSGERSAWNANVDDAAITLRGRGWSQRFGEPAAESEESSEAVVDEAPMPSFPGYERQPWVETMASSSDGKRRVALVDPTGDAKPFLVNEGSDPIALREPPGEGFGIYCGLDYDEEYGEETYFCDKTAEFAPTGEWFVVGGGEATASFDVSGRRLGTTGAVRWVRFVGDERALVHTPNGALFLAGKDLRQSGVLFRARERMTAFATISDDQRWVAAVRGAALAIHDVETNERKHVITLPSRAASSPIFVDDLVQVRVQGAFLWYRLDDGSEARKVELDSILAIDADRTHALTCADDRLRHVTLASPEESEDLGACPLDAREIVFDDERVWWVEGSRAHVVRLSDAEHLIVGMYLLRQPLLYAFTPRGHFWTNRPDALRSLRVRMAGPVLEAEAPVPEAGWIRESLIGDYLSDRDLGDAPER